MLYYKMWSYIIQNIVLSILIVLLLQYLWDYFKSVNSSKKTRDLVDFQTKKYREILKDMRDPTTTNPHSNNPGEYISAEEKDKMVSELLSFIEIADV